MKTVATFFLLLLIILLFSCKKDNINPRHTGEVYLDHSTDIAVALQNLQNTSNHLWPNTAWWISANTMDAMLDYSQNSGNDISLTCKQIYNANQIAHDGGFKNTSYDDCAWWALAWIKAYDLYGDTKYLETGQDIFAYMATGGWDTVCGGGMNWQNTVRYKNAITNQLFILLAARIAERQTDVVQKAYYLDWALNGWSWLNQSGMLNSADLFNDGLNTACNNNHERTWTYNQGVVLAGLKELSNLTSNQQYLQTAHQLALASISQLSDANSILTEPCNPDCNENGQQFKGIYIKYLSELNTVLKETVIKNYIVHNAAIAWGIDQNSQHLFDGPWQGPFATWSCSATCSALNLMNAATIQLRQ